MGKEIKTGFIVFLIFTFVSGLLYPLFITGVAQFIFKDKANGSLIKLNGKVIGSELIGQKFTGHEYFHGRPSSISYTSSKSGASNLGPTSKKLIKETQKNISAIRIENMLEDNVQIPPDLVLSSASGLDPDISIKSAELQIPRIAKERGISEERIHKLISKHSEHRQFWILGNERVNVLKLNLALDKSL